MTFDKRWLGAEYSSLTIIGRIFLSLSIMFLLILPAILFPDLITIEDLTPGFWSNFISDFAMSILGVGVVLVFCIIVAMIWAFMIWIITGRLGIEMVLDFIIEVIFVNIATTFKIVFGNYDGKWYFLKEWFKPNKVAKEMLGENK